MKNFFKKLLKCPTIIETLMWSLVLLCIILFMGLMYLVVTNITALWFVASVLFATLICCFIIQIINEYKEQK